MTGMFGVILFTLLPIYLNAKITPPTLNNVTYIQQGSDIILKWKFTFALGTLATRTWRFIKTGETIPTTLAIIVADGAPTTFDKVFKGISVTKPATLILKDASVAHSGTYRFEIAFNAGASPPPSDIMVIIPVRPTAKVTCSGEGDAASCLCEGIDGIPAADTTWLKGKKTIKGPEDLSTTMVKKDIIPNGEGVYTCKANSANLTDEASVTLSKPKNISFKSEMDGDRIKLVCKVVGTPAPVYLISLNGSVAKEDKNGVKYIGKESVGQYECLAKNVLGNATKYLFFNGTAMKVASTPKTPTGQSSSSSSDPSKVGTDGEGDSGGLGTGAIVGIVVGVLFLIVVVVALVYWFCIKQNECCCACCVLGGKDDRSEDDRSQNENPAGGYVREDNPYASVDEERERPDKGASTSRNQARPAAEMPPVYAAVDKTKKNKKPPPDAQQPALTYASLDPVILQPDSSKMRDRSREETNYAAIDLEKLQSDLV